MYEEGKAYKDEPSRVESKLPLNSQEKAVAGLHDTIDELTRRLNSVLTPVAEKDHAVTASDREVSEQSPLAEQLDNNNRNINRAGNRIRVLIERLEC